MHYLTITNPQSGLTAEIHQHGGEESSKFVIKLHGDIFEKDDPDNISPPANFATAISSAIELTLAPYHIEVVVQVRPREEN